MVKTTGAQGNQRLTLRGCSVPDPAAWNAIAVSCLSAAWNHGAGGWSPGVSTAGLCNTEGKRCGRGPEPEPGWRAGQTWVSLVGKLGSSLPVPVHSTPIQRPDSLPGSLMPLPGPPGTQAGEGAYGTKPVASQGFGAATSCSEGKTRPNEAAVAPQTAGSGPGNLLSPACRGKLGLSGCGNPTVLAGGRMGFGMASVSFLPSYNSPQAREAEGESL